MSTPQTKALSVGDLLKQYESGSAEFSGDPNASEEVYKIYAESFQGEDHLRRMLEEAQVLIGKAFAAAAQGQRSGGKDT